MKSRKCGYRRFVGFALPAALVAAALMGTTSRPWAARSAARSQSLLARLDLVGTIKKIERTLGFGLTDDFLKSSKKVVADYRCYYTGTLNLPDSYQGLMLKKGTKEGCAIDPKKYDVFFYPMQAVGDGKSPLTTSLAKASVERLLFVVPHEDFHQNSGLQAMPPTINEAASTLIGMLTATEVAREKFGPGSDVYRNLSREPELFLEKARIVNRYHAELKAVYAAAKSGKISKQAALDQKHELFRQILSACSQITPRPTTFNKYLSANNNAGLAFDETYTKYYPIMHRLALARGQDLKSTINALNQALAAKTPGGVLERLQELTPSSGLTLSTH